MQTQFRIAGGATLKELGLVQENIKPRGVAIQCGGRAQSKLVDPSFATAFKAISSACQRRKHHRKRSTSLQKLERARRCRITTENPERDFAPDAGTLAVYRHAQGVGMRIDGVGYTGMKVTPYRGRVEISSVGPGCAVCLKRTILAFQCCKTQSKRCSRGRATGRRRYFDSLLVKYTARADSWQGAVRRMRRALLEMRIRGVKTNIPFLLNVLEHPDFIAGDVTTSFIGDNPDLVSIGKSAWDVMHHQSTQDKVFRVERNLRHGAAERKSCPLVLTLLSTSRGRRTQSNAARMSSDGGRTAERRVAVAGTSPTWPSTATPTRSAPTRPSCIKSGRRPCRRRRSRRSRRRRGAASFWRKAPRRWRPRSARTRRSW